MATEPAVESACKGLKTAVRKYWDKYEKRLDQHQKSAQTKREVQKRIQQCVGHACHIVRQLHIKCASLQGGVAAFQDCWAESYQQLEESRLESIATVLPHVLHQLLRLRDGLVLLTNGECRHPGDQPSTKYPSRFEELSYRKDGYTRLYSSQRGYTGYGWDEFYDPTVGVQQRLCQVLRIVSRRKSTDGVCDALLDMGAQTMESFLDEHNSRVTQLRQTLEDLRQKIEQDLRRLLQQHAAGGTVLFVTQDKMEKLEVILGKSRGGVAKLSLHRRGDEFRVVNPKGALPNSWTVDDWRASMKMKTTKNNNNKTKTNVNKKQGTVVETTNKGVNTTKKRRLVLDDSSDEESNSNNGNSKTSNDGKDREGKSLAGGQAVGLRVQAQDTTTTTTASSSTSSSSVRSVNPEKNESTHGTNTTSLEAIKTNLGVNAKDLEKSREAFESETGQSKQTAESFTDHQLHDDDDDYNRREEQELLRQSIDRYRIAVRKFERVYKRFMSSASDPFDVWDARECLRENKMFLGKDLLALQYYEQDDGAKEALLFEAEHHFRDAHDLVLKQQKFHRRLTRETNDDGDEAHRIRRNMYLLRGRALTNLGIVLFELTNVTRSRPERRALVGEAIEVLGGTIEAATVLRNQAMTDRRQGADPVDTAIDSIQANQTKALALKWLVVTIWHTYSQHGGDDDDNDDFDRALSDLTGLFDHALEDEAVLTSQEESDKHSDQLSDARVDYLVECYMCAIAITDMLSKHLENLRKDKDKPKNKTLFGTVIRVLRYSSSFSQKLSRLERLSLNKEVTTVEELTQHIEQLERWWAACGDDDDFGVALASNRDVGSGGDGISGSTVRSKKSRFPSKRFTVVDANGRVKSGRGSGARGEGGGGRVSGRANSGDGPTNTTGRGVVPQTHCRDSSLAGIARSTPTVKTMKWGDELLPNISASSNPTMSWLYPACAPQRPSSSRDLVIS